MKEQIELLRASASLPYVSRIVEADGMKLLDGGCTDSIPLMASARLGFKKNVVAVSYTHLDVYKRQVFLRKLSLRSVIQRIIVISELLFLSVSPIHLLSISC